LSKGEEERSRSTYEIREWWQLSHLRKRWKELERGGADWLSE
jgi:hypothetical protein